MADELFDKLCRLLHAQDGGVDAEVIALRRAPLLSCVVIVVSGECGILVLYVFLGLRAAQPVSLCHRFDTIVEVGSDEDIYFLFHVAENVVCCTSHEDAATLLCGLSDSLALKLVQSLLREVATVETRLAEQGHVDVEPTAQILLRLVVLFKELFGGGKGTLELVEDEDVIEAGIRIISQPPGKKLQNMMQLSGGEKALTAIALLFAIQNLKPSPFCLLDEIEAALDDSNVGRYANYLHKLTKHTQFIVITHRRGTMAAADRLYGITMQEKGVSGLLRQEFSEEFLNEVENA